MNIAYDTSTLFIRPLTGVGNYVQHLLTHLLAAGHDNAYYLLSHRAPANGAHLNGNGNARWVPAHFPNRLLWTQCVLPLTLRALQPEVAHFPNFVAPLVGRENVVVTVHDLGLISAPHLYTPRQRVLMRPLLKPSARRAGAIIAVSQQSKRDVERILQVEPSKVHVVYEAAAPFFGEAVSPAERERRLAAYGWDPAARHLLCVGTMEPRKNLGRLLGAVRLLHQRGARVHLWLVGQAGWQAEHIAQCTQALGLGRFVHQTGYIPSEDLRAFYHGCDICVLPSLNEGFGLPVIEAMTCGTAVIVSDIPALREIAADAALFFDALDEGALADVICRVLTDDGLALELRQRGQRRSGQFSWERAALETLAVYRQVAA
jgi:glycosyltransferase involved in cell wall biosynthesis